MPEAPKGEGKKSRAKSPQAADVQELLRHEGFNSLVAVLSQFNPYSVLGLEQYELRHTRTLAWLLDPAASHGLGTEFLERFLEQLHQPDLAAQVATLGRGSFSCFSELVVDKGWLKLEDAELPATDDTGDNGRLDVYLQAGEALYLCVEAKVGARESEDQLQMYRKAVEREAAGRGRRLFVFLTLDGARPLKEEEQKEWLCMRWHDVASALKTAIGAHGRGGVQPDSSAAYVRAFLESYLATLHKMVAHPDHPARQIATQLVASPSPPIIDALDWYRKNNGAKAVLRRELKGAWPAMEYLAEAEDAIRARQLSQLLSDLLGSRSDLQLLAQSEDRTQVDFVPNYMAGLRGKAPRFRFRLDARRSDKPEVKLFFDGFRSFPDSYDALLRNQVCAWIRQNEKRSSAFRSQLITELRRENSIPDEGEKIWVSTRFGNMAGLRAELDLVITQTKDMLQDLRVIPRDPPPA